MSCISIEDVLAAQKPEDIFGDLPIVDVTGARLRANAIWQQCAKVMHPDVNDDPRAEEAMRILNGMIDKVRHGRYGERNVEVLIRTRYRAYKLNSMCGQGDVCNLYQATYTDEHDNPLNAVVKIVRDRANNDLLTNEARKLKRLLSNIDTFDELHPYLPRYIETFGYRQSGAKTRQAVSAKMLPNLYSLSQIKHHYPNGVHAKDAAWMFRRILYALSMVHENGIIHGALTPDHILIEPEQHGIILVDWKHAVEHGAKIKAIPAPWRGMYPQEVLDKDAVGFGVDLFMAARVMVYILGGDPNTSEIPDYHPKQIAAFLKGTAISRSSRRPQDAAELRDEYTDLIERLWGKRVFRPFLVYSM